MYKEDLIEKIESMKFAKNEEVKKEFLKSVCKNTTERTTKLYIAVMSKTIDKAEEVNGRDWVDFTPRMVDDAFIEIQSKSIITLQSYLTIIKHYLSDTTPMENTDKSGFMYTMPMNKDSMQKYVNKAGEAYRYITPKEFNEIIMKRTGDNMGKAILILLYLGIKGTRFEDICKIKNDDIDLETGDVFIDNKIVATIPQEYIPIFESVINAEEYHKYDIKGNVIFVSKVCENSPYLIKRRVSKNNNPMMPPDQSLVSSTLDDLGKSIKNQYLTGVSVFVSGEVYRLLEFCDMEMPTSTKLTEFRTQTGSKLSFVTMKVAAEIILNKLKEEQ